MASPWELRGVPYGKPADKRRKYGNGREIAVSIGEAQVEKPKPRVTVEIGDATDIRRDAYQGAGGMGGPRGSMRDAEQRRAARMTRGARRHSAMRTK